jgi:hypothetical protein
MFVAFVFSMTRVKWKMTDDNLANSAVVLYRNCPQADSLTPQLAKTLGGLSRIQPESWDQPIRVRRRE